MNTGLKKAGYRFEILRRAQKCFSFYSEEPRAKAR